MIAVNELYLKSNSSVCAFVAVSDMSLYGVCPSHNHLSLVICERCHQSVTPQGLQLHYGILNLFFLHFIRPPGTVVAGGLMFYCGFFVCGTLRCYISEMAGAIALKLSHMIGSVGT